MDPTLPPLPLRDDYHWKPEICAILAGLLGGARYGVKIRLPHALVMTCVFRKDLSSRDKLQQIMRMTWEHASHLAAFATIYKTVLALLKFMAKQSIDNSAIGRSPTTSEIDRLPIPTMLRWISNFIVDGFVVNHRVRNTTTALSSSPLPLSIPGRPERWHHAFIAGAVGGYLVWGQYTSVNYQIVLYLTSRVIIAAMKRLVIVGEPPSEPSTLGGRGRTWLSALIHSNMTYRLMATAIWGIVMILFEESPQLLHPSLKASMEEIYRYKLRTLKPKQLRHHETNLTL